MSRTSHCFPSLLSLAGLARGAVRSGRFTAGLALYLLAFAGGARAVAAASTATTLAVTSRGSAVTTVASGAVVTLMAKVTAGSTPVTLGTVNFCDASATYCTDIKLLGTAQLTKAGTAVLKFRPGIGGHSYKAVFLGTTSAAASSSSASALAVTGKYATATTIAERGNVGNYWLTASVAGFAGTARSGSPSGSVAFLDTSNGNQVLGTATLSTVTAGLSWVNSQTAPVGNRPESVAVGDFNGDGIPDLAITNVCGSDPNCNSGGTVTILLGKGDGTFTATATSPKTGNCPEGIAVGDFNGDGNADLAVTNDCDNTVTILLGNGDGTFTATAATPATGGSPGPIVAGDFNGDGNIDLAVVDACSISAYCTTPGALTILLGDGHGGFTATATSPAIDGYSDSIAVADFNGDGIPDLAVASPDYAVPGDGAVTIFRGNGDGTFTEQEAVWAGPYPVGVVVGDFNGDGKVDLAAAAGGGNAVTIMLGNGNGTFQTEVTAAAINGPRAMAVGDFNGDGHLDLAVISEDTTVIILLGNGDGTFTVAGASPATGAEPYFLATGDFEGYGVSDLAVVDYGANAVSISLTEPQTAAATAANVSPVGPGLHEVAASYPGDDSYRPSVSGTIGLMGPPPATTTTLTLTSGGAPVTTVQPGSAVTLTAAVQSGGAAVTTGQANFCDASAEYCTDIHLLGTQQLTSAGTAVLKFVPKMGSHRYKAVFLETASHAASSSSTLALTVTGKYATATTITQTGLPGNYTLTATVDGSVYEVGLSWPTGMVSFLDSNHENAVLGTATLGNGTSALSWLNPQSPAGGNFPVAVAVGDFNGDGIPDLAAADELGGIVTILLGNGDGTFREVATPKTGSDPFAVVVADFNGDGIPDLAVVNADDIGSVTILLGNGNGTFTAAASPAVGSYPYSLAVGDFNGDGIPDLAVANGCGGDPTCNSIGSVTILLGKGDGTFTAAAASPATGHYPSAIAVGDFNGDGKADLAVANSNDNTVTILLGNGDGTFRAAAVSPATGSYPYSMAVGDFNGDGKADLAVVNQNSNTVTILLGTGQGTFTVASTPATGSRPSGVAVGDFNGDGIPDLAIPSVYGESVTILLGKGNGTFTAAASPAVSGAPNAVAVGEFNRDGVPGLAVTTGINTVAILLANLTQTATATASGISPVGAGPHLVEASYPGDSNYSSSVSAAAMLFSEPPPTGTTLAVTAGGNLVTSVVLGTEVTLTATVGNYGAVVTTGQVNFCDAKATHCTDIHLLGTEQLTSAGTAVLKLRPGLGSHSYKAVFLGTTSTVASTSSAVALTVTAVRKFPTGTALVQGGSVGDYTLTATVAGTGGATAPTGTVSFLDTSDGNALLGSAALVVGASGKAWVDFQSPLTGRSPVTMATGDFNADGIPDIAIGYGNSEEVTILLGNGDGTFTTAPISVNQPNLSNFIAVGDFNSDGIPDLAVATEGYTGNGPTPGSVTIWLGNGDGTFTQKANPATGIYPQCVAVGDFNGDGIPDLAVANYNSNTLTILLGKGDGTFTATAVSPATGSLPYFVAVGDFNRDGKADLAVANSGDSSLTILLGNGDGTFKAAASPATGKGPAAIVVGDFNGDGIPDLAVPNYDDSSLTILLGTGNGTFTATTTSPATLSGPAYIVEGDFNGNGILDLAVANLSTSTVTILQGNGNGTFTVSASPAAGANPDALTMGDFNGDGKVDVAVADFGNANGSGNSTLTVLLADEQASVATVSGISPAGSGTHLVEASYSGSNSYAPSVSATVGLAAGVALPVFNPPAGTYYSEQSVTITDATAGATIYYAINQTPTTSSTIYSGPITVRSSETLEAIAVAAGSESPLATAYYAISGPLLGSLSSSGATAGGAGFTLTVNGANFAARSMVLWNGALRKTTYVSSTELTAAISAADIAKEATNRVTVANPAPNPGTSSALPFVVMSATPVAAISGGSIAVAAGSSGSHVLTLTGTDFATSSTVEWNGASLTTTYVSPWQISAAITASDYNSLPAKVTVKNPAGISPIFELP